MRPPSNYQKRYASTADLPQSSGSPARATGLASLGPQHHLAGIEVETAGTLVYRAADYPPGVAVADISRPLAAGWHEIVVAEIDPASTCFPLVLHYGPLGVGAR